MQLTAAKISAQVSDPFKRHRSVEPTRRIIMFIRIDSTYINLDQIAQVERLENSGRGWHTRLTLKDGTERNAHLDYGTLEGLTECVVPAPLGYEVLFVNRKGEREQEKQPVIAFAFSPYSLHVMPVTVYGAKHVNFALRTPEGQVFGSMYNKVFPTEEAFLDHHRNYWNKPE
jgi:hypothetical protein